MATEVVINHWNSYKSEKRVAKASFLVCQKFSEDLTSMYDKKDKWKNGGVWNRNLTETRRLFNVILKASQTIYERWKG